MRTYEQYLKELNISAEEFDNIISHIYDKTADEMAALAKAIKSGAAVLPTVKRAFERVLTIRQAERQEAYNIYYNDLNTMCYSCKKCGISCNGTIEEAKEYTRQKLAPYYSNERIENVVKQYVSVVRPGVVLVENKNVGLMELYL